MTEPPGIDLSKHVARMHRVALRIVGDADRAHEAVQNACVKAMKSMGTFDGRAAVSTWLHRIVVNCAFDQMRKRSRETLDRIDLDGELAGMVACLDPGPMEEAAQRELSEIASAALEELPDEYRAAFVLTQLDGYSYDEAAAIQQRPRGTVASRVCRAKQILMERVAARSTLRVEA